MSTANHFSYRVIDVQKIVYDFLDVLGASGNRGTDAAQIATRVSRNERIADAARHSSQTAQDAVEFGLRQKAVGLDDGHFQVQTRQKLPNRRDFVEPVQASVFDALGDHSGCEIHRQRLGCAAPISAKQSEHQLLERSNLQARKILLKVVGLCPQAFVN